MTTPTATPAKLRSGAWGARIATAGLTPSEGDTITITARSGKSWTATIAKIVWEGRERGNRVYLVSTATTDRSAPRPRPTTSHTSRPVHRANGGYYEDPGYDYA